MIAILLCTYNGDNYLRTQLDSLLDQTYKDFKIYIHDDGSTDETVDIIKEYTSKFPNIITYVFDETKHRGAGASFMWLLNSVKADYYMFCDQDDFWLPNKVEATFHHMINVEHKFPATPILIHTDLKITDANLRITHDSFWQFHNFKVDISKKKQYIGLGNIVTGCTVMINDLAKTISFPYNGEMLHDYWIALNVAKYGIIDNIKEQTILYRQHGNNEAGAGNEYKKHQIRCRTFMRGLREERDRVKYVSGRNLLLWFYYRIVYFFHRHLS